MISKNKWEEYWDFRSKAASIEEDITTHMSKCIRAIYKLYDGKVDTWYFPDAAEGEMGTLRMCGNSISIQVELVRSISEEIEYKSDTFNDYLTSEFPTEFLFLSVEEVVARVSNYREEQQRIEAEKKRKAKERRDKRKATREALKASAVKKLTTAERKALGL